MKCPVPIIYEDEHILVVNKPAFLPMHANLDAERENLVGVLSSFFEKRDGTPGYFGIHQRLDVGTSGVVILARSHQANASLASQFEHHSVDKRYLAIVSGTARVAAKRWEVHLPLADPSRRGGPVLWPRRGVKKLKNPPLFKECGTVFILLKRSPQGLLLEAKLLSGRKHQIRAHLAAEGRPLVGDTLYGGPAVWMECPVARPMLHAFSLGLLHPVSGRAVLYKALPPADFMEVAAYAAMGEAVKAALK